MNNMENERDLNSANTSKSTSPFRQKLQKHSLLVTFLLPYLALLAIPILVMSIFLFYNVRSVVETRTLENSLSNLRSAKQQIDQVVEDLINLHTGISDYVDLNINSAYERFDAQRKFKMLFETNGRLEAIYDYWFDDQYVISTEGVYDLNKPYTSLGSNAIPITWFASCITDQYVTSIQQYGDSLFFVFPGADYQHFSRHMLAFQIKRDVFLEMLGGQTVDVVPAIFNADNMLIAGDADGKLDYQSLLPSMTETTGTMLSSDGSVVIAYAKSELTGWTLVHIHDLNVIMGDLIEIELIGVALMLAIAVLGCFVILPAIKATYKPIADITCQVQQQTDAGIVTNFKVLARRLEHVYATNRELSSFSETCRSMLKSQLFTSIERGQVLDEREFWSIARIVTGGEICSTFALVLVRVHECEPNDEMVYVGLLDAMKQYLFPEGNIVCRWSKEGADRVFAMLLNGHLHSAAELCQQSQKLLDDIDEDGKNPITILIATELNTIKLVRQSFFAGMEALFHKDSPPIILLDKQQRFSNETLKAGQCAVARLEASLAAGQIGEARKELNALMQTMSEYCRTSIYWAKYIGYDIMSTVMRNAGASVRVPTESMILNLEAGCWREFMGELDSLLEQDDVSRAAADSSNATVEQICRYVDAHLSDPTLSIQDIAESMGYSYKYTSYVFRQQTGNRLSEYISRRRVDEFKVLAANGNESISELIKCVGFENPATFHRLFKQLEGMTPGQYRQRMRHSHDDKSTTDAQEV